MAVIVDTRYIQNTIDKINATKDCSDFIEWIEKELACWVKMMEDAIAQMQLAMELMIPPTDLQSLIEWAEKICAIYVAQYNKAILAIAEITAAYAQLVQAIMNKVASLMCASPIIPTLPTP